MIVLLSWIWLPFYIMRIKYKTSCLCYQIITGTAPQYLADFVQISVPSGLCTLRPKTELFASPPSKENSMVVGPSVFLLYKHLEFYTFCSPS